MANAQPSAPQAPLTQADYSAPTLECDVVMKGGITSGVVYPLAVCELAKTYRFRCIGGTSAGAIAAAATAAAEYGRRNGAGRGFQELANLPRWLGEQPEGSDRSNLFSLFQPQPRTDALFDAATAKLRGKSVPGRMVQRFPLAAVAGALPGAFMFWVGTQARPAWAVIFACAFALALAGVGALAAAGWMLARKARKALPENGFGLCSGNGADVDDPTGQWPALTPWLADLINRLAGKPRDAGPLTFGDLWDQPKPDGERAIDLRFMTTCLTHGRPYQLPLETEQFYYAPTEMRRYFPEWVMLWMDARGTEIRDRKFAEAREKGRERAANASAETTPESAQPQEPYRDPDPKRVKAAREQWNRLLPLPPAADLPVVVAARMSLSFPVLISAVPLYAVDYMSGLDPSERAPERCWFSDGGICSNFPVHFFDSPVPSRPTFGINLRPFPENRKKSADEAKNTWFPMKNNEGIVEWFARIDDFGWKSLAGFAGLIVNAVQNWVDNTQLSVPGYRDRVAHVLLTDSEGGLNLNMPDEVIRDLGTRGQLAARELARRYDPRVPPESMPLTWDNHRWVRLLSSMHLIDELLRDVAAQYDRDDPGARTYADLVLRGDTEPKSYRIGADRSKKLDEAIRALQALRFLNGDPLLEEKAPRPRPELRIRPRL
jgi:predicted acylesterase/phospholipase RssA